MDVQNVNGDGHSSQENRSLAKFGNSRGILAKWNSPPCLWGRPNPYFAQEDYWSLKETHMHFFKLMLTAFVTTISKIHSAFWGR